MGITYDGKIVETPATMSTWREDARLSPADENNFYRLKIMDFLQRTKAKRGNSMCIFNRSALQGPLDFNR